MFFYTMGSSLYNEGPHTAPSMLGIQSAPGDPPLTAEEQRKLQERIDNLLDQSRREADNWNALNIDTCSFQNPGKCITDATGLLLVGGIITIYVLKNI